MTNMPGNIARSAFMKEVDDAGTARWGVRRKYALGLLMGHDFQKVYEDCGVALQSDHKHMQRHFLGEKREDDAYWPDDQWGYLGNKQEIIRIGALEAIRVAHGMTREDMVPENFKDPSGDNEPSGVVIETVWICAGHHFECCVVELEPGERVLRVFLTPSFPDIPDDKKPAMTDQNHTITVVGHQREMRAYQDYYPDHQDRIPPLIPVADCYQIPRRKSELSELTIFEKWVEER